MDDVLFIDDVARLLKTSRATIERKRRHRVFPIAELPPIDKRPRWSRASVDAYLRGEVTNPAMASRRGFRVVGRGR